MMKGHRSERPEDHAKVQTVTHPHLESLLTRTGLVGKRGRGLRG